MAKVWILERHIPYEGFDIVGVFSSEEEASERLADQENDSYVSYEVSVWELDGEAP